MRIPILSLASVAAPPAILRQPSPHAPAPPTSPLNTTTTTPLLIWHGLGDSFDSDGIASVADLYTSLYPRAPAYAIRIPDADDRRASYIGNVSAHIESVCAALAQEEDLVGRRVHALGFSQGGQFLRGLAQRCDAVDVAHLVTFGSQHLGIQTYRACGAGDWLCDWVVGLARRNTWSGWTQSHLVPAQYFRDPEDLDAYRDASGFLADVNNERAVKNQTYRERLVGLERFSMFLFTEDEMVVPKQSAWFGTANQTLRETELYREDWLGLRELDERGALRFEEVEGGHMQISDKVLRGVFKDMGKEAVVEDQDETAPHDWKAALQVVV